jgi:hypothetical protein
LGAPTRHRRSKGLRLTLPAHADLEEIARVAACAAIIVVGHKIGFATVIGVVIAVSVPRLAH